MKKIILKDNLKLMTDEELAQAAQQGSTACFAELVDRFGPRIYHFFRYKVSHDQDAEDLTQDAFAKAFRNIRLYQPRYKFSTWIFTISNRLAISFYRSAARRRLGPIPPDCSSGEEPADILGDREAKLNLWILARKLPGRQYDVLWLKYVENMSVKEIARTLDMSRTNVKVQLFRARSKLAEWNNIGNLAQQIFERSNTDKTAGIYANRL